jgi:hypothetical protein
MARIMSGLSFALWKIFNRQYIPPLPRMLATNYNSDELTNDQSRVLARIGARDPAGIKRAFKIYQVDNINDLVAVLEHYQPRRNVRRRLYMALARLSGGYLHDPHADEVKAAFRKSSKMIEIIKIKERQKKVKQTYDL